MVGPVQLLSVLLIAILATATQQTAGSAVVAGQVVDAVSGRPVGGAVVTLALGAPPAAAASGQPPAPAAQARRGIAVAAADGRFAFRDVPAGTFSLTATLNGYAPGATGRRRPGGPGRSFTIDEGARLIDAVIPLWRLAAIEGTVRDDRGEPAVGVPVWALRRTASAGRLELTLTGGTVESTDERGRYRLSNLMPGAYVVAIRTSTQSAAVSTVDAYREAVTSGTSADLTRSWSESGALGLSTAGIVVDGWQVSVSLGEPQPLPGPNGTLLVHPTMFHPQATLPGDATVLTLGPGDERLGVALTLPLVQGFRVAGVLQGPDGPAANHGLRLYAVGTSGPTTDLPVAYSTTDNAGRFAFIGVPAGAYLLRAYRVPARPMVRPIPPPAGGLPIFTVEMAVSSAAPDGPALFADVTVTVGSSHVDDLALVLQPGARMSGQVAFVGSAPDPPTGRLQQISLSVRPLVGSLRVSDVRVDGQGRFTTSGYPAGSYAFVDVTPPSPEWRLASVRVAGTEVAGQAFTIGSTDIDDVVVTFTDTVMTLSGMVRTVEGGLGDGATVVAFPADVRAWLAAGMPPGRVVTAVVSATGAYQVRIPLPGDYLVVAVPPEVTPDVDPDFVARFAQAAARVSLTSGETKTQALTVSGAR